jgi:hypothetical protein
MGRTVRQSCSDMLQIALQYHSATPPFRSLSQTDSVVKRTARETLIYQARRSSMT